MTVATSHSYAFGPFQLNPRERLLRREGRPVALTPKAVETLILLVQHRGHLVDKDELMKQVWPDTFVEEGNLTKNIFFLRKILGKQPDGQEYIETIPKRGYRFSAPVRELSQGDTDLAVESHSRPRVVIEEEGENKQERDQVLRGRQTDSQSSLVTLPAASMLEAPPGTLSPAHSRRVRLFVVVSGALLIVTVASYFAWRRLGSGGHPPAGRIMLAVLPLENLTGDPGQEYFSDGLTEEMITQLGRLQPERLGVIARTSVLGYKQGNKRMVQIGRELGVDYALEGSVRREGGRVRITAQLIQVKDQSHLWAESYDRNLQDILALQSDVAQTIAGQIRLRLTKSEQTKLANARPINPQAYENYLKGRYFWNKRTEEGLRKAIEYFQQAVQEDPEYALAYAGLADSYVLVSGYGVSKREAILKAKAAARKAVEIDDSLGEAHASLALIAENYDWNWSEAEREYKQAIKLSRNYATAHHWYSKGYLAPMGRFDEALAEIKRAQELDPLSLIINTDAGAILYYARQYDQAIEKLRSVLDMDPSFGRAHVWLGLAYEQKGIFEEAIANLQMARHLEDTPRALALIGHAYAVADRRDDARKVLADLKKLSKQRYVDPWALAMIYIGLEEKDPAMMWLEKAYQEQSADLTGLKVSPAYDSLRADARFSNLVQRVGLPM